MHGQNQKDCNGECRDALRCSLAGGVWRTEPRLVVISLPCFFITLLFSLHFPPNSASHSSIARISVRYDPPMASPFICPRLSLVAFARFPVQSRFHYGQFLVRNAVGMRRCRRALLALGIRHGKQRLSRSRHCWMRSCAELENPTALPRPRRAPKGSAPPRRGSTNAG
jgi:hypothetical protein